MQEAEEVVVLGGRLAARAEGEERLRVVQGVARHGSDAHAILRRRLAHRAVASHCVLLAARLPRERCRAKAPPAAPQRLDRRAARHEQRQLAVDDALLTDLMSF